MVEGSYAIPPAPYINCLCVFVYFHSKAVVLNCGIILELSGECFKVLIPRHSHTSYIRISGSGTYQYILNVFK